jgi:hypothetical protein
LCLGGLQVVQMLSFAVHFLWQHRHVLYEFIYTSYSSCFFPLVYALFHHQVQLFQL